ncbi:MAG: hypothetical protein K6F45_08810 [Saccharofermentans sp.]|nr:hypothetical protein [Saccharofermentans sp.]
MHDYLSLAMMLQPIDETSLILFDVSNEEKGRIIRQYNRALANAQGDGTDVAQIFLKPLISQYEKWGDPALMFGLCLAREGQFKRAEGSLAYAIAGVLQSEQYLTIAQEALRMVREDIKNPPENLPPVEISDKIKSAQMASGESPAQRTNFQAPILRRAQKEYEAPRMATVKERRDIMMRSGGTGDELPDDQLEIEDVRTPGDKMRSAVKVFAVIFSLACIALIIIFGVIPFVKQSQEEAAVAAEAAEQRDYLLDQLQRRSQDPEVSSILNSYNNKYGPGAETAVETAASESETETTTEATTEEIPAAQVAETTTAETTAEGETEDETAEGEDNETNPEEN